MTASDDTPEATEPESDPSNESLFEYGALPKHIPGYSDERVELVELAVGDWTRQLIDLGGRNNLLHFRDLKRGTLDLTSVAGSPLDALLRGRSVRISKLFPEEDEQARVVRRVRTIHRKAKENEEERGVETLALASGLATWRSEGTSWKPRAPVLLRQAKLKPVGAAQGDFELSLVDEMEVNPTLVHFLDLNFNCTLDQDDLLNRVDGVIDEPWEMEAAYDWSKKQAKLVPEFDVEPRLVLANFSYAKLPMVKDLKSATKELVGHDLIAAIAGDDEAREKIRESNPSADAIPSPDHTPLANEFLVLDADSSQNYAINAVLAGANLIIKGPPGTGKSQTISNLIGALIAQGKKVLFVAEKRAAIDAVFKRLRGRNLGDLVLELYGGVGSRRSFAESVGRALDVTSAAPKVENEAELRRTERQRTKLNDYVASLHEKREPWGVSIYDARAELLSLEDASSDLRFREDVLDGLTSELVSQVEEDLAEYVRLGGLVLRSSGSAWAASTIASSEQVQAAHSRIDELRRQTFARTLEDLADASEEVDLPPPSTAAGWESWLRAVDDVGETLSLFDPALFEEDLAHSCNTLAPAADGGFARLRAFLFSSEYRERRTALHGLCSKDRRRSDAKLLERCEMAVEQLERWHSLGGQVPRKSLDTSSLRDAYAQLLEQLHAVEGWTGIPDITDREVAEIGKLLAELLEDQATLMKLPELHRLRTSLEDAGLGEFLSKMEEQQASEGLCLRSFRSAWLGSIVDHFSLRDSNVGGFVAERHEGAVEDFKQRDRDHIEATADRIRRLCAERAVQARDEFPDQDALIRHQARLKKRHRPVRELVELTSDVLLALKPCWAMSPLVVSQLLPAKTHFDVVIFDEASQITPADAISSILRGSQLVVAGDERQLPPTSFFLSESAEDEDEDASDPRDLVSVTQGFESILDAVHTLLGFQMLSWHYRSQDERLIAFSNAHLYDRMLTTFPGVGIGEVLEHVEAPWEPSADTNSPTPEVNAVVDLILEHAETRPSESLGVIAMGIKHANRIEESLRHRLGEDVYLRDDLADFFDENREERFFVKNLERVQGDERDAIILSIGYGKNERGALLLRFGPVLMEGGERRLNVAVTRSKKRITLVSSFSSRDMDPERLNSEGMQLLRQYLQYVESQGKNLGDQVLEKPELNAFEVDIRDTLAKQGLKLTPQYGSSGRRIDFAAKHPNQPGHYVLAIECDGASYHSSQSARDRDRLRQEQLERLGWRFCRIWSSEWFSNKERATSKVLAAFNEAVREVDKGVAPAIPHVEVEPSPRDEGEAPAGVSAAKRHREPRPRVSPGLDIQDYSQRELSRLAQWIESDGRLRTEEELVAEMMRELGFARRGKNVAAAIRTAIRKARA